MSVSRIKSKAKPARVEAEALPAIAAPENAVRPRRPWMLRLYALALCCLPLLLIFDANNAFALDWTNHVWLIGYFGEYFRQHHHFPVVINSNQAVGMAFPVFYGYVFYPIAGLVSIVLGANLAMRLVILVTFFLQTMQVIRTVQLCTQRRVVWFAIAALADFAIYPLTNLYNRSAITELIAASLLMSACCAWLRTAWRIQDGRRSWRDGLTAATFLAISSATHPVTAFLGLIFFAAFSLLVLHLTSWNRRMILITAAAAGAVTVVLLPWLYAVLQFSSQLGISANPAVNIYKNAFDNFFVRICPYPFDNRVGFGLWSQISTPYLDAQINMPLLGLFVFLLVIVVRHPSSRRLREFAAAIVCIAIFVFALACSTSESIWHYLPSSAAVIQWVYRMVTYCDLALLLGCLLLMRCTRNINNAFDRRLIVCLTACVSVAACDVFIKLEHASAAQNTKVVAGSGVNEDRALLTVMPSVFYGANGYITESIAPKLPDLPGLRITPGLFQIGTFAHFGEALPQNAPPKDSGAFVTNVQCFPWNRIYVNGQPVSASELYNRAGYYAMLFPPLGRVEYRTEPALTWSVLRMVSTVFLIVWFGFIGYLYRPAPRRHLPVSN